MNEAGLRERRKQRTRDALFAAAMRLFHEKGYANTTVAEIAAAADVSTKTLFNHFSGKEDLLFAHRNRRIDTMHELLAAHAAAEPPGAALRRTAEDLIDDIESDDQAAADLNIAQAKLIMTTPELQARSLVLLYEAQRRLAAALHEAYPGSIDPVTAASAVGSLIGAMQAAVITGLDRGAPTAELTAAARHAVAVAARGLDRLVPPVRE